VGFFLPVFTRSVKSMALDVLILQLGGGLRASVPALIASSSLFAKAILAVLIVLSVYSWAIIWNRMRLFSRVKKADQVFITAFRRLQAGADCRLVCEQHPHSVIAQVALAGQRSLDKHPAGDAMSWSARYDLAQRAMDRSANDESAKLEKHLGFLATTGSVSPFIGLMGTVWGVMMSFLNIGAQGSASLMVVAPGIAEALIATVAGLAAAIPATVGYNHFLQNLRELGNSMAAFSTEFLDRRVAPAAGAAKTASQLQETV
jgi:biopolymer transport protein TolQ